MPNLDLPLRSQAQWVEEHLVCEVPVSLSISPGSTMYCLPFLSFSPKFILRDDEM